MMARRIDCVILIAAMFWLVGMTAPSAILPAVGSSGVKEYVTFGIFIAGIEEGGRIFTPTRLLPFAHPGSEGHEFPTAQKFHQKEYEALVFLGGEIGLKLQTTLLRYPRQPVAKWWYAEFDAPPIARIRNAPVRTFESRKSPIPGLKAVVFQNKYPICFIVDTRGLSLEARGMKRATAMGLDLSRREFLQGFAEISAWIEPDGFWIAVFKGSGN